MLVYMVTSLPSHQGKHGKRAVPLEGGSHWMQGVEEGRDQAPCRNPGY